MFRGRLTFSHGICDRAGASKMAAQMVSSIFRDSTHEGDLVTSVTKWASLSSGQHEGYICFPFPF